MFELKITALVTKNKAGRGMKSLKTPGDILIFLFLFPTNWNLSQGVLKITAYMVLLPKYKKRLDRAPVGY